MHSRRGGMVPLEALNAAVTNGGERLSAIAERSRVLLVFLRHAGCTFCREALADLASARTRIERERVQIVIVHQSRESEAAGQFARYGIEDLPRISDPELLLYAAFNIRRGSFWQLFGPSVLMRGIVALLRGKHGIGLPKGDPFQMPGTFLIQGGEVLAAYPYRHAGERPDYEAFVCGRSPNTASGERILA